MGDTTIPTPPHSTALDVVGEMLDRVKATDPRDMEAVLFAAWEALRLTLVLDLLLEQRIAPVDQLPFPGFTWEPGACRQKLDIAMCWLEAAPSLPNLANSADEPGFLHAALVPQTLAEKAIAPAFADLPGFDAAEKLELVGAEILHTGIRTIWLRIHELLTAANEHATAIDDGRACRIAALMTEELAHPETVDTRRDLNRRVVAAKIGHCHGRHALLADTALLDQLRTAVTRSAGTDGWAELKKVVAALRQADREWMPERWGYDTDLGLISATSEFEIRKVDRDGRKVPQVRVRHHHA
ncbi:hypothetical protein [Nocardia sp. NBC_01388]|uniref:hypothetical protein n=1 Tax=Nocardia sp. NBC_01388 TaxID=2903596 RepID=UPI0032471A65